MNTYTISICTDPLFGYNVMHSAAQPYAVVQVEVLGSGRVLRVYSRHATLQGSRRAAAIRRSKERAAREAIRIECEKPVPYGC